MWRDNMIHRVLRLRELGLPHAPRLVQELSEQTDLLMPGHLVQVYKQRIWTTFPD